VSTQNYDTPKMIRDRWEKKKVNNDHSLQEPTVLVKPIQEPQQLHKTGSQYTRLQKYEY